VDGSDKLTIHFRDIVLRENLQYPPIITPLRINDLVAITKVLREDIALVMAHTYGGPETKNTKEAIEIYWNNLKSEFIVDPIGPEESIPPSAESIARHNAGIDSNLETGHEFRLLYLLPASNWDDPLECSLVPDAFENAPQYKALSYTWGLQKGSQGSLDVVVNGEHQAFQITTNLDSALRDLRSAMESSDKYLVLWVDAVCIKRRNMAEKSHQIQQMKRICSEATRVVVWLGKATDKGSEVFKILDTMEDFIGEFSSMMLSGGIEAPSVPDPDPLNAIGESPR
jgi:hypothetical protein